MVRQLPPLNSLRAFEATARHLSFSKAADELAVTPAALSHQVRGLEERLGLELFTRRTRSIELTEAAHLIYSRHSRRLRNDGRLQRLDRMKNDTVLVVSATPGFTVKLLRKLVPQRRAREANSLMNAGAFIAPAVAWALRANLVTPMGRFLNSRCATAQR
jgi:LysR family transcriptional regulator, glycine cleavage system transcriptional activator